MSDFSVNTPFCNISIEYEKQMGEISENISVEASAETAQEALDLCTSAFRNALDQVDNPSRPSIKE